MFGASNHIIESYSIIFVDYHILNHIESYQITLLNHRIGVSCFPILLVEQSSLFLAQSWLPALPAVHQDAVWTAVTVPSPAEKAILDPGKSKLESLQYKYIYIHILYIYIYIVNMFYWLVVWKLIFVSMQYWESSSQMTDIFQRSSNYQPVDILQFFGVP